MSHGDHTCQCSYFTEKQGTEEVFYKYNIERLICALITVGFVIM
jgi:hypothetical protein